MKAMVRPCFWFFFYLRPALLLPPPDLVFIALQGTSHRTLATPSQLPQNPPGLRGVILHPAFPFNQIRHSPASPQAVLVAESFGPTLQDFLDPSQVFRVQARAPAGTSRLAQSPFATLLQFLGPTAHRLPMHPDSPRHLRLVNALPQQLGCLQTTLFQLLKIPPYARWVSHAATIARKSRNVTILFNIQESGRTQANADCEATVSADRR
jgi:hypothetical protein